MSFLPWGTFKRPCPMPACWASANMQPSQWRAGWERITARFLTHQPLLPLAPACGWAPQALAGCRSPDPACRRHSHPWGARRHPDTLPQAAWASSASQPCFKPALALCSTVHHGATAIPAALVGVLIHTPISRVSSAPPAPPGSGTPKRTLDIPGSGLCPNTSCTQRSSSSADGGPMGWYRRAGLGDPPHPRVLAHLPGHWDGCVCSAWRSESLLCLVCPRQLCWIQLGAVLHLAYLSKQLGLGPLGVCCFALVLCCQGFCIRAGQGGLNHVRSHAAAVNTGQGTARGSLQRWGQACDGLPWVVARAQPCHCPSSTPLSYKSCSLAPGSTSHPMHSGWLVLLPQMPVGCAAGT